MSKVLTVEQREQAGSDSYNRFEYQVHWIVCHIISKLQEDAECIVFCEFHDDMAEFSPDNQQYQFFQVKTKEDSSDWTIAEMSKREKKKSGGYKKSFLGFIFYNYLVFGAECSHCHFVSNNDFDKEVLLWQAVIEDGKKLQEENSVLYQKIKNRLKDEFTLYRKCIFIHLIGCDVCLRRLYISEKMNSISSGLTLRKFNPSGFIDIYCTYVSIIGVKG